MLEKIDVAHCRPAIMLFAAAETNLSAIARNLPHQIRHVAWHTNSLDRLTREASKHRTSLTFAFADGESAADVCRALVDVIRTPGRHAAVVIRSDDAASMESAFLAAGAFAVCRIGKWHPSVSRSIQNFCKLPPAQTDSADTISADNISVEQKIIMSLPWRPVRLGRTDREAE